MENPPIPELTCPHCRKGYKSKSGLSRQIKICPNISNEPITSTTESYQCSNCEKSYQTKSGPAKHLKTCADAQRKNCKYCGLAFSTFTGLRAHESRSHKAEETASAAASLPKSNLEWLRKIAEIEASLPKGQPLFRTITQATGLTKDQVRHKREKPLYTELLRTAKSRAGALISTTQPSTSSDTNTASLGQPNRSPISNATPRSPSPDSQVLVTPTHRTESICQPLRQPPRYTTRNRRHRDRDTCIPASRCKQFQRLPAKPNKQS